MFTSQIECAYKMADIARAASPNATIIIGGPHVSVFPLEALHRSSIDYVIIGEGEERLAQLLESLSSGTKASIQGVVSHPNDLLMLRTNPRAPISYISPLDKIPLPAYDLVDMDAYFQLGADGYSPRFREWGKRPLSILTSRGCPHKCVFCSIQTTMGYKFRHHSDEYVQRHIQHLVDNYGVDFIHFEDDNFTHIPERYDRVIEFLRSLKPGIKWDTPNGIRGDTWTLERLKKTKESGCQFLIVAIESAVQRVIDNVVRKRLDLSEVEKMIRYCSEIELRLHAFYIIGFPGETTKDMQYTVDYTLDRYERYGVFPQLQPLIPIPGTDVYDSIMEERLYQGELSTKYNQVITDQFDTSIVDNMYKRFLRRRLWIFAGRSFTSLKEFAYNLRIISAYPQAVFHALRNAISGAG